LPANLSKAQRGFLLAQDALDMPQRAQTPKLDSRFSKPELAQVLLGEMFAQFTQNLDALRTSDDPEVVHQARVGWRRFKSGVRLFRKTLAAAEMPSRTELQPLLTGLGELRNLDVALTETLPSLSDRYAAGDAQRAQDWQTLMAALTHTARLQRQAVRRALQEPGVGMCLLALTEWLENLSALKKTGPERKEKLRDWARRQTLRMHQRLEMAQKDAQTEQEQHRVRILAKRLRYGVEALRDLLPKRLANTCLEQALRLQSGLGLTRDVSQAGVLVARNALDPAIAAFLRGVAVGANLSARE
jgi:CHAD domain-containing protein